MSEDMDVEALQAQIDLSNSISYDIVSSWVKPAASPSTESVSRALSRELEAFAKRPPRLGLGASVPKSSLATSREAIALKRKLAPRTRPRDGGGDVGTASRAGKPNLNVDDEDEDEDESRSAAISMRKAQINGSQGLGLGNHKKHHSKKKARHTEASSTTSANVKEDADEMKKQSNLDVSQDRAASSSFLKPNPFIIPQTATSPQNSQSIMPPPPTTSQPATPSHSKKRRKRGKKKHESHRVEDDSVGTEVEEWTGFSN